MAVSKDRSDWALLLLRLAAGGYAIVHGLGTVMHAGGKVSFVQAFRLGQALLEMVCGGLLVTGVWMLPAAVTLALLSGWPLAQGWMHGGRFLSDAPGLFRILATLASGLGGPGKWSPSN